MGQIDAASTKPADPAAIALPEGGGIVEAATFRHVLGHFASGVTVITALDGDIPVGFACQSFASLSLDPPLVTFFVAKTSTTWPRIRPGGRFCVNVLAEDQEQLCRGFAVSGADKFAGVAHSPAPTGSPKLDDVLAWIDCTLESVVDGGDHEIVIGRVQALDAPRMECAPLLFYKGRFGHPSDNG
ncbi:flavin reductase family protein [Embleya sp. NPDC001921]